jgi:hypothetical protein
MTRTSIINYLIDEINAEYYLEIGVENPYSNFEHINCRNKVGIDPIPKRDDIIALESDEFFSLLPIYTDWPQKYDVIFIDGLHHEDQVERDIINSLNVLNDGGYIVCHDMNPATKEMQAIPRKQNEWTGSCWKAWVKLKMKRNDIIMKVVDTDYGCGIIQKGSQDTIDLYGLRLDYDNLTMNRKKWLNLISIDTFINKHGGVR